MENFLSLNQNVFDYIDSLQDIESVRATKQLLSNSHITRLFWKSFKKYLNPKSNLQKEKAALKCRYINRYFRSGIPLNTNINVFHAPHAFYGIFISSDAKIGKGCTIFHHVTIGSNTLPDSKNAGAPIIGDNVYIGAGAKIIGNVKIGNNVRIGAGCVVTRDVPDNCTVVQVAPVVIQKHKTPDNRWITIKDYRKLKAEKVE